MHVFNKDQVNFFSLTILLIFSKGEANPHIHFAKSLTNQNLAEQKPSPTSLYSLPLCTIFWKNTLSSFFLEACPLWPNQEFLCSLAAPFTYTLSSLRSLEPKLCRSPGGSSPCHVRLTGTQGSTSVF